MLSLGLIGEPPDRRNRIENFCNATAEFAFKSSLNSAKADHLNTVASCINFANPSQRSQCAAEAMQELDEALELIQAQNVARLELCVELGPERYNPVIEPANFVSSIDNPFLPIVLGRTLIYEAETDEGLEVVTITVSDETREILGVECTIVHDVVELDGELVEDTQDWFAQDVDGNVWYFGELSLNYEDNELVDISGSWEAGVDGAQPGIVMQANPVPGMTYRLEFLVNEAEDAASVVELGSTVVNDLATYTDCLHTSDFTPLEPDALEDKFYAPGIGLVLETKPDSDERLELVAIIDA